MIIKEGRQVAIYIFVLIVRDDESHTFKIRSDIRVELVNVDRDNLSR
jgi:hypothetical protein